MVISPPQSPNARTDKAYPLFNKLLEEAQEARRSSNLRLRPVCPATAPVIKSNSGARVPSCRSGTAMADENVSGEYRKDTEDIIQPITLQDPPKCKLKRQLSVESSETHERLRLLKKPNLGSTSRTILQDFGEEIKTGEEFKTPADEVDGGCAPFLDHKVAVNDLGNYKQQQHHQKQQQKFSPVKQYIDKEQRSAIGDTSSSVGPPFLQDPTRHDVPARSPNLFDLNDIGLTSPFTSTTPKSPCKASQVFVYPESLSTRPRKLSPYRKPAESSRHQVGYGIHENIPSKLDESYSYSQNANYTRDIFKDEMKRQTTMTAQLVETERDTNERMGVGSTYVTAKGFNWPINVTITEAIPISPRVVSSDTRPKYPVSTSSSYNSAHFTTRQTSRSDNNNDDFSIRQSISLENDNKFFPTRQASRSDSYNEDLARLHRLEKEYERALEILGCPQEVRTQVIRSISAVDRSPNEKNIRETREEVRNKYERTFSHPLAAPRINHYMSSQIGRESPRAAETGKRPQQTVPWLTDARRRLFARSDSLFEEDRREIQHETSDQLQTSTDIPEVVLNFLHSKNFHPEELENLKDVLRRGGMTNVGHPFMPTGSAGDAHALARSRLNVASDYRRLYSHESQFGPIRERRRGDIDVRLSCDSVVSRSTQEIMKDLDHDTTDCRCSQIEDAIRQMALQAYSQIRRTDTSPASHTQFQNEIHETNTHVYESMQFLCAIKCICKYGRTLEEVFSGSVVFRLNCPNIDALLSLWEEYKCGTLLKELQNGFVTEELKEKFDCEEIILSVTIFEEDYVRCKTELETALQKQICKPAYKSPGTSSFHARSRSEPASVTKQANQLLTPKKKILSPFRERFCSDSSVELSPRRAFQEINAKEKVSIKSPSKKQDGVFLYDSPLMASPKQPAGISTSPQGEQENVGQSGQTINSPRDTVFQSLPWLDQRERVTQL